MLFFILFVFFFFFFFFQAEDGIRDLYVTGVQTCALPISARHRSRCPAGSGRRAAPGRRRRSGRAPARRSPERSRRQARAADRRGRRVRRAPAARRSRSEERRVGKEWRSRWSPDQEKKRKT